MFAYVLSQHVSVLTKLAAQVARIARVDDMTCLHVLIHVTYARGNDTTGIVFLGLILIAYRHHRKT